MSSHYQSLLIVMVLTGLGWLVVRRHFAPMMPTDEDFARRRNLWLAITFVAFVMPSFWAYAAFAAVGILYGVKRDSNPAALYPLLLIAIPPLEATIPGIFGVHHQRLLTLILLLPMLPRNLRDQTLPGLLKLPTDKIMLAYLALQVILYWPYMAMLPLMRYTLLLFVNTWLPYFVMSRAFATKAEVRDAMACFVLSVIILSPLAIAETRLSSLLYSDFSSNWGIEGLFSNLKRDGTLRSWPGC